MTTPNDRNVHQRDRHVSFDAETHTYTIKGSSEDVTSVTTLLGNYFEEFDPDGVLDRYYDRWQQNPYKKREYYGKTREEIKQQWERTREEAAREGTELHDAIEAYYNGSGIEYDTEKPEWKHFLAFQGEHDLKAYRTEMTLWSQEHKLGGRLDLLVQGSDGTYAIYDWKRSKDKIWKQEHSWNRCGSGPLSEVRDNKYYRYSMQLNIYRELLERYYGYEIKCMYIVRLHPNTESFEVTSVDRMEEETIAVLAHRKDSIAQSSNLEEQFQKLSHQDEEFA